MNNTSEIERQKEAAIDALRLKAFETNSDADRQAYFDAVSKWFQDRHIRRVVAERGPFLPVQGAVKKLDWIRPPLSDTLSRCDTDFGTYRTWTHDEANGKWFWSVEGGWNEANGEAPNEEAAKAAAQADYEARILAALEPAATCNESLQVEPAAPEAQLAAFLKELSGNPGELIDRMAAAIRDWGSHYDDGPWETLPEDRKAGWRGDAERALAVVKDYLTARRPSEQAVTEAMELARAVLAQSITAGHNVPGPTPEDIEKAFWALDAALKSAMEAGR